MKRQKEMETFCRASTSPSTSSEADQTPECAPAVQKRIRSAKTHKHRQLQKLEQKIKEMKRMEAKYRKRCQRLNLRLTSDKKNISHKAKSHIKKTLLFYNTLIHHMQKKIKRNMHSEGLSQPGYSGNTNLFLWSEKQLESPTKSSTRLQTTHIHGSPFRKLVINRLWT